MSAWNLQMHMLITDLSFEFYIIFTRAPSNFVQAQARVCPGVGMPLILGDWAISFSPTRKEKLHWYCTVIITLQLWNSYTPAGLLEYWIALHHHSGATCASTPQPHKSLLVWFACSICWNVKVILGNPITNFNFCKSGKLHSQVLGFEELALGTAKAHWCFPQ